MDRPLEVWEQNELRQVAQLIGLAEPSDRMYQLYQKAKSVLTLMRGSNGKFSPEQMFAFALICVGQGQRTSPAKMDEIPAQQQQQTRRMNTQEQPPPVRNSAGV